MLSHHIHLLHIVTVRRIGRLMWRYFSHDGTYISSKSQRNGISASVACSIPVHARESKDFSSKAKSVYVIISNELYGHWNVRTRIGPPFWHKASGKYIG